MCLVKRRLSFKKASIRCQDVKLLEYTLVIDHTIISAILTMTICRSSEATDVDKQIYGSTVPVLTGEKLTVRILVSSVFSKQHILFWTMLPSCTN